MFNWKQSQFIKHERGERDSVWLRGTGLLYLTLSTSELSSSMSRIMVVSMLRLSTGLALSGNSDIHINTESELGHVKSLEQTFLDDVVLLPLHGVFVGSRHHRATFLVLRRHHLCSVHGFSCLQLPPVAKV